MPVRRRAPRYKKKQQIRRRRMMKGRRRGKAGRYHGIKYIKETINKGLITMPAGGAPLVQKLVCNFADISQTASWATVSPFSALQALYGRYCITGVKWTFIPLSTQSVAGSKNVDRVVYAINRDPQDTVTGEQDIIRQDDCKFTNTARKFSVYVKHPEPMIASTANQSLNNKGLGPQQYNQPTGGTTNPNQVMASPSTPRWTWLPTRVYGTTPTESGPVSAITSDQFPDHVGLDLVITSQQVAPPENDYAVYTVFQTLYIAFKEQD